MRQPGRQANTGQGQRKLRRQQHTCALCRTRGLRRLACISQGTLYMCLPCTLDHLQHTTAYKASMKKKR